MNFQQDVIQRSHEVPVLVDFWAEWCGPCRILSPVLDEIAETYSGRFELVKIDTEEFPQIAQQYRVMSIPSVKLFRNGAVIDEFTGALPRTSIVKWLEENLPTDEDIALQELLNKRGPWPDSALAGQLEKLLEEVSDPELINMLIAREIVLSDPARAIELTKSVPSGPDAFETSGDIRALAELMTLDPDDSEINKALQTVRTMLSEGQTEQAIKLLVDIVMRDKSYAGDLPRRAGIALFRMLGTAHPLTKAYRRLFDMAIY